MTWALAVGFVLMTLAAGYYKYVSEELGEAVLAAYRWVDEIIEALGSDDEVGNQRVDQLVADRVGPRSGDGSERGVSGG